LPRELAPESRFNQPKVRVVATAVRPENLLVAFGDDRESAALGFVNRPLEIDGLPRVDDESATGHAMTVDREVGDSSEGAVVPQSEFVDLSWSGEDVT
jgi:hypothetical protein